MSDQLKIEVTVTFPDDTVIGLGMSISEELYTRAEIPNMIQDTMIRGARAINRRIQEKQ